MDSSFLTGLHIGLGLFATLFFLKLIIQFGLPNHPGKFVAYMVGACISGFFIGQMLTDLGVLLPWVWMKWRALPLIAGGLFLLLQTIMLIGSFSLIQQKVVSRLPLMAALVGFAFFNQYADYFVVGFLLAAGLFLIISVRKARYQKRIFMKMLFFFMLHLGLIFSQQYVAYIISQVILFFTVFYLFMFEHSLGITAKLDDFQMSLEGERK